MTGIVRWAMIPLALAFLAGEAGLGYLLGYQLGTDDASRRIYAVVGAGSIIALSFLPFVARVARRDWITWIALILAFATFGTYAIVSALTVSGAQRDRIAGEIEAQLDRDVDARDRIGRIERELDAVPPARAVAIIDADMRRAERKRDRDAADALSVERAARIERDRLGRDLEHAKAAIVGKVEAGRGEQVRALHGLTGWGEAFLGRALVVLVAMVSCVGSSLLLFLARALWEARPDPPARAEEPPPADPPPRNMEHDPMGGLPAHGTTMWRAMPEPPEPGSREPEEELPAADDPTPTPPRNLGAPEWLAAQVREFVERHCETEAEGFVRIGDFHEAFRTASGSDATKQQVGEVLGDDYEACRVGGKRGYRGIKLRRAHGRAAARNGHAGISN